MKALFYLIIALMLPLTAAARTAMDAFVDAPDAVLSLIPLQKRLDLRDYFIHSQQTGTPMPDRLPKITAGTDNSLSLKLGRGAEITICVVPAGKDSVIAVIERVLTPTPDATVMFYKADWQPLPLQPGQLTASMFGATAAPAVFFADLAFDPATGLFKGINTTKEYYSPSSVPAEVKCMADSVNLRFDGKKWKILRK